MVRTGSFELGTAGCETMLAFSHGGTSGLATRGLSAVLQGNCRAQTVPAVKGETRQGGRILSEVAYMWRRMCRYMWIYTIWRNMARDIWRYIWRISGWVGGQLVVYNLESIGVRLDGMDGLG